MKSLRIKLFTGISMFVVALALLIVGVWAVGQSQTITMEGSVNFNVADKSLYVKDVRMQEDNNSTPYSLKEQDKFMPGYINGNFNMNLGEFTNDYGTFALYFDIINTMDESTGETFAYTVDPPTQPSNGTATITILDNNGDIIEQIPQGTVKPSQITDSIQVSATIKLTVSSTSSSQVDLSEITITINQYVPEVYAYFDFEVDEQTKTATLIDFDKRLAESTDIVIPATVDLVGGVWQDGTTYTVTAITDGNYRTGVFYDSGITSVTFPSSLTSIGSYVFYGCSGLTGKLNLGGCTSLISIGGFAFDGCSGLTSISLPSSLKAIGNNTFSNCSGLTGKLNLGGCTSLTSIGNSAFSGCSGLTSADLSGCTNLTSIGRYAFYRCSALKSVVFPEGSTGWYVTQDETATSGKDVDVKDSSINASNLTGQYSTYYWKRNA